MTLFSDLLYHATLEQTLMESFPQETFHALHLPTSTYPTIYQKLPRYSKPSYPKHLFVKEEFSHLPTLKKRCIDKALLSLYEEISLKNSVILIVFTYVIPGGLGDYFAQQLIYNHLIQTFPHLQIHTVSLVHNTAPLALIKQDDFHHVVHFSDIHDLRPNLLPHSLLTLLRNSSLILQVPTLYPDWEKLIQILHTLPSSTPMPHMETIGEYGFICSPPFYPATKTRCLGLHFLEHGVLLDFTTTPSLTSLKDKNLLNLLLPKQPAHRLYLAYLCTPGGHALYLYSLLLYLADDLQNIDLCTPDIGAFLEALDGQNTLCKKAHIKEIHLFYKNHFSCIPIQSEGKTLRIIHTGPLDHDAFKILLYASQEPIGIRGNLSLSEAISFNKVYFYDLLSHNTTLYYGLLSMAEVITPHAYELLKLYNNRETPIETAQKLAHLMRETPSLSELKILGTTIQKQHCALPHIRRLIIKILTQRKYPELQNEESLLVEAFSHGTLPLEEVILPLRKALKRV